MRVFEKKKNFPCSGIQRTELSGFEKSRQSDEICFSCPLKTLFLLVWGLHFDVSELGKVSRLKKKEKKKGLGLCWPQLFLFGGGGEETFGNFCEQVGTTPMLPLWEPSFFAVLRYMGLKKTTRESERRVG